MFIRLQIILVVLLITLTNACDPPPSETSNFLESVELEDVEYLSDEYYYLLKQKVWLNELLYWENLNVFLDFLFVTRTRAQAARIASLCINDDPRCDAERVKLAIDIDWAHEGSWYERARYFRDIGDDSIPFEKKWGRDKVLPCNIHGSIEEKFDGERLPKGWARARHFRRLATLSPEERRIRRCRIHATAIEIAYRYNPSGSKSLDRKLLKIMKESPHYYTVTLDEELALIADELLYMVNLKWGLLPLTVRD